MYGLVEGTIYSEKLVTFKSISAHKERVDSLAEGTSYSEKLVTNTTLCSGICKISLHSSHACSNVEKKLRQRAHRSDWQIGCSCKVLILENSSHSPETHVVMEN